MDLFEYQARELFAAHGVPVLDAYLATTPEEAAQGAEKLGCGVCVVKAQVKVGGRGKAGGVKLAHSPDQARERAQEILGMDIKGHRVHKVMVAAGANIEQEFYFSVLLDRAERRYLAMCSVEGGMEIERLAVEKPEALARVHNLFERVHPFLDGNGRTGRLALNLLLVRLGYPPAIIYKRDRDRYLRAMRRADAGEYGPLGELIARSVTGNLHRFVLPSIAGPDELVPLSALSGEGISEGALRVAAIRGRLRAVKGDDGAWRSSRQWVTQYQRAKYSRTAGP
jgi:hypothetical protein